MREFNIEKADRKRYRVMVWQTVGFGLFLGLMMFFPGDELFNTSHVFEFLRGLGAGLGIAATLKLASLQRKVNTDKKVSNALSNEMYRSYDKKALVCGFYAAIITAFVIFVLEIASVDIRYGAGIILYAGVMTARIAQLIYYR